jgi:hypothetical protein
MQKIIDKTLKPVLIIGGLGTAAAGRGERVLSAVRRRERPES